VRDDRLMNNFPKVMLVGALVAGGAFFAWPRGANADKAAPGQQPSCQQWEVMVAPAVRSANEARPLPEAGKPIVESAPAGWEPFAFGPTGQLVFRRCAK
jgi:hypothetical protein